jgi:hypothetical protein
MYHISIYVDVVRERYDMVTTFVQLLYNRIFVFFFLFFYKNESLDMYEPHVGKHI